MINRLFDRMDTWRHLPNYQLERRADIFFSLYLQPVLQAKFGTEISPVIIPEFPVHIRTIYPHKATDKSFKIDYVCFSADMKKVFFVELKTDGQSRNEKQDKYLDASRKAGLKKLLKGILKIFQVTNSKRKYFCLLDMLAQAGFLDIPHQMYEIIRRESLQGITEIAENVRVLDCPKESEIVYVQPNGQGSGIITFKELREVVEAQNDPVSERLARSLEEWASVKAGLSQYRMRED